MEIYKIKIYKSAQNDLIEIVEYLNTLSPDAAIKYYDLIVSEISSLARMPERYKLLQDTSLMLRGYRSLLVKSYIVFYVVKDDTVQIHRILYAKRQYEDIL